MYLLLLVTNLVCAAKPAFCRAGSANDVFPLREGEGQAYWLPVNFREGALRPGVQRLLIDLCRCLPRRQAKWPASLTGTLWIQPTKGSIRIAYVVSHKDARSVQRIQQCLGESHMKVEPMSYRSDMVFTDGREEAFPPYPVVVHLK